MHCASFSSEPGAISPTATTGPEQSSFAYGALGSPTPSMPVSSSASPSLSRNILRFLSAKPAVESSSRILPLWWYASGEMMSAAHSDAGASLLRVNGSA